MLSLPRKTRGDNQHRRTTLFSTCLTSYAPLYHSLQASLYVGDRMSMRRQVSVATFDGVRSPPMALEHWRRGAKQYAVRIV